MNCWSPKCTGLILKREIFHDFLPGSHADLVWGEGGEGGFGQGASIRVLLLHRNRVHRLQIELHRQPQAQEFLEMPRGMALPPLKGWVIYLLDQPEGLV